MVLCCLISQMYVLEIVFGILCSPIKTVLWMVKIRPPKVLLYTTNLQIRGFWAQQQKHFHARYFMLCNSVFDDKCSCHIVSLMAHLSLSFSLTHIQCDFYPWMSVCVCVCVCMHTGTNAHWGVEWWMGLSNAHICILLRCTETFIWGGKTWREKHRWRNSDYSLFVSIL